MQAGEVCKGSGAAPDMQGRTQSSFQAAAGTRVPSSLSHITAGSSTMQDRG